MAGALPLTMEPLVLVAQEVVALVENAPQQKQEHPEPLIQVVEVVVVLIRPLAAQAVQA